MKNQTAAFLDEGTTKLLLDLRKLVPPAWQSRIDARLRYDPDNMLRLRVGEVWNRLTPRQQEVLSTLWQLMQEQSFAPTVQEVADRLGISKVSAYEHLAILQAKGAIRRPRYKVRNIQICDQACPFSANVADRRGSRR